MPRGLHLAGTLLATALLTLGGPAAAGAVGTADATDTGHGGAYVPMRVVSYNIQAGANMTRAFDPEGTIAALRSFDADVIALQEVDVHWSARSEWRDLATEIADALGMRTYFAPIYSLDPAQPGEPRREFGLAVLSRYRITDVENHSITRLSTQDPDPAPAPAPGFPEVELKVAGEEVHVYDTHLDYRADPAVREMQVADMLQIMAEDCHRHRCPQQILAGDFNAPYEAPELAPLWEKMRAAQPPEPGHTYPADAPVKRIDYVTVAGGARVVNARVPDTLASDHRPVVADLLVRH